MITHLRLLSHSSGSKSLELLRETWSKAFLILRLQISIALLISFNLSYSLHRILVVFYSWWCMLWSERIQSHLWSVVAWFKHWKRSVLPEIQSLIILTILNNARRRFNNYFSNLIYFSIELRNTIFEVINMCHNLTSPLWLLTLILYITRSLLKSLFIHGYRSNMSWRGIR